MPSRKLFTPPPDTDLMVGVHGYPYGRCTARTKRGLRTLGEEADYEQLRCKRHCEEGYKVCRIHGANANNHGGTPPVTGLYSKFLTGDLADRIHELQSEAKWADLANEIVVLRALLTRYLERNEELNNLDDEGAHRNIVNLIEEIGKSVERKHKIDYGVEHVINIQGLAAYAVRIADIINNHVADERSRAAISDEIAGLLGRPSFEVAPMVEGYARVLED